MERPAGPRQPDPRGLAGRIAELRRRDAEEQSGRWFLPLAGALRDAGRPGEAAQVLRRGLAREPEGLGGWVLLGQCYSALEEWAAARRVFEVVIGRDRENAVALRGLAAIHARLGEREQAAAYCRALLRLMPRDLPAQEALAELLEPAEGHGEEGVRVPRVVAGPVLSLVRPEPPPARRQPRFRFGRRRDGGIEAPARRRERLLPEPTPRPGLFEPPPADLEPAAAEPAAAERRAAERRAAEPRARRRARGRAARPGPTRSRRTRSEPAESRPTRPQPGGSRSLDGYRRWLERMAREAGGSAAPGEPPAAQPPAMEE